MEAIRVGAIASPATNSASPITTIEPTNASGSITRARTTLPTWTRNTAGPLPAQGAGHQPGEHAAERPEREQHPGVRLGAAARRRRRPWPPRRRANIDPSATADHGQRHHRPPRHRRPGAGGVVAAGGARARCARWAARTSEPPTPVTSASPRPGPGVPGGGEHGDHGRADDEDRLVDDRLEGVRRLDLARARPPARRTTAPARTSRSAGTPRRRRPRLRTRRGPASPDSRAATSTTIATPNTEADHGQHPRLAEPVEQPALHDRHQRRWR